MKITIIKKDNKKQHGFSLIELLVAMMLGLVVMAGVFQVFLSTKTANNLLREEAKLQENARFAFSVITSIVQEAGSFGCLTSTNVSTNSVVNTNDNTFKPWRVIEGWEAKNTNYGDSYAAKIDTGVSRINTKHWLTSADTEKDAGTKSKKYSDILKVWYTKKQKTSLTGIAGGVLRFPAIDLGKGDILVINDCQTVNFAQVCACEEGDCAGNDTRADISAGACNSPGNLAFNSTNLNVPTTEIGVLQEAIIFVSKRSDSKKGYKKHMPSLYIRNLSDNATPGNKQEILEGVESLQVLYGEDTSNDYSPNYYVSADQVVNWQNIVSIRMSLLLRSQKNNLIKGAQSLAFNGAQIRTKNDDHYLRRVFTSTISLRNRNIGY